MNAKFLNELEKNQLRCSKCKLIIPFTFKKGDDYTTPSFTIVDDFPICYRCYHPKEFSLIDTRRRLKSKEKR